MNMNKGNVYYNGNYSILHCCALMKDSMYSSRYERCFITSFCLLCSQNHKKSH